VPSKINLTRKYLFAVAPVASVPTFLQFPAKVTVLVVAVVWVMKIVAIEPIAALVPLNVRVLFAVGEIVYIPDPVGVIV
jgi:hypothetical protein